MSKLSQKDTERLTELRSKLLDEKGDYREKADFDELQELAKLEALADDQPKPPLAETEKETAVDTKVIGPKKKAPKIVRKLIKQGYDYYGVDKNGVHILYNNDEGMFYRLNRDPNFVDALAEGLTDEYLGSLK